jgi:hypothetical protein
VQACKRSFIPKDVIAKHPELTFLTKELDQEMSSDREEEKYAEADSRSSGLTVHGRGRATSGDVWVNRGLKSFDGVRRISTAVPGGDGESIASRTDAPDYDPSDDST